MKIVCFGDSVTRGITYVNGRLRILKESYPALLQSKLSLAGVDVVNKGVFNDNSDLLVERLHSDVLELEPEYVLIEIGGNDCNFRWDEVAKTPDEPHEPIVPLDRYLENLRTMVTKIQEIGAIPVVMNLLPLDPVRYYQQIAKNYGKSVAHWIGLCGGIEHWHGMYNRSLRQLVDKLGIFTVDVRSAFKRAAELTELLSDDGIHPTAQGYSLMMETVGKVLMPRLTGVEKFP